MPWRIGWRRIDWRIDQKMMWKWINQVRAGEKMGYKIGWETRSKIAE